MFPPYRKVCPECGRVFFAPTPVQIFCGPVCRKARAERGRAARKHSAAAVLARLSGRDRERARQVDGASRDAG